MNLESPREKDPIPDEIRWRVHPLTENFWKSALLIVIIVAVCFGVWFWTYSPGMVLVALVLLVVSVATYLLPVEYHMTQDGIEITFVGVRRFRGWEEFRNYYPHDAGVHLSTFRRPSGLDSFRGSYIRLAPGDRDRIVRFLDVHIKRENTDAQEGESD